jgi:glycosyltransferase involved in cell wall biosynthesis
MLQGLRVGVAIPAYKVERHVAQVIVGLPDWVDQILVVDDASPDGSAARVQALGDPRVQLLRHEHNQGVGAALRTAYTFALQHGLDVIVKMDGDGQMDPAELPRLLHPLVQQRADYAKGNRFHDLEALKAMPRWRRYGNVALTLLAKAASGYWNLSDPTNGYTAIRAEVLRRLDLVALHPRYFFEQSLLIQLGIARAVVAEVHMPARYGDERSSMSLARVLLSFPFLLARGLARRVYWRYFFYEMTATSVFLLCGLLLTAFGLGFGGLRWYVGWETHTPQTAGTVLLAALPFILGFQLLLQALVLDVQDVPREPLCRQGASAPRA